MAIQTTYPLDLAVAFEGMQGDGFHNVFRHTATNIAAESFFGRACLLVVDEGDEFVQPTGSAGVFMGILQHTHAVAEDELVSATAGLPANQPGAVMRTGRIWVVAEDVVSDISVGVFYRHATPGGDPEFFGRFRTDADTAAATVIPEARWVRTTSAVGELTQIELNLP